MSKEILFTIARDATYDSRNVVDKLKGLCQKGFEKFYDVKFVDDFIQQQNDKQDTLAFNWNPHNVPGQWMSENISVPNKVIPEPITLEKTREELESGKYESIVISTYLSGYSTFRDIARYVRTKHPEVKIIVGSVGALLTESSQLADFTLKGDQVGDLRTIIGQPKTDPLRSVNVQSDTEAEFNGVVKKSSYALLISSLGCMYGCDFCPSTAQFGKDYRTPFSATEIVNSIISAHDRIAPDSKVFTVSLAEAQGMGNIQLWKQVFKLARNLPFQAELVSTTSSKLIQQYDINELTSGALRLSTVNIGIESLLQGYKKNQGVDLKAMISKFQKAGINVVCTYILGLDWQTKDNIKEEVKLLKDLGSSGYIVSNLEMQPGTPLYTAFKKSGRLLEVPPELLNFYGYQAYSHPNFISGFNDMLPLIGEVEDELSDGNQTFNANLRVFLQKKNQFESRQRSIIKKMIKDFSESVDPKSYIGDISIVEDKFAAELYFHLAFRNMDLFHPYILSTN